MASRGRYRSWALAPWGRVETVLITRVDVSIVGVAFANRIVRDVLFLSFEVVLVTNAMFVVAGVPHLAWKLFADGERVSSFDELDAASSAHIDRRCDKDVEMVRHDREGVECELTLVAVAEERGDHEFGVIGALENPVTLVGEDGDRVGAELLADRSHGKKSIPQGLKPRGVVRHERPSLKAWLT